jgi:PBP1b-binding outer membrane lipoprotein LpoB
MNTVKKVAGIAMLALVLAACSTAGASDNQSGDKTFNRAQMK